MATASSKPRATVSVSRYILTNFSLAGRREYEVDNTSEHVRSQWFQEQLPFRQSRVHYAISQ